MHEQVLQIYRAVEQERLAGKPVDQEIIYTWSRRALRAQLRASRNKDERIAAFRAFVDRATTMRDAMQKRYRSDDETLDETRKSVCYLTMAVQLYINEKAGKEAGWVPLEPLD